jgi:hypothetical protein
MIHLLKKWNSEGKAAREERFIVICDTGMEKNVEEEVGISMVSDI